MVFETKFSDHDMFHDLRNHDILYPMVMASSWKAQIKIFPPTHPGGVIRDEPNNGR